MTLETSYGAADGLRPQRPLFGFRAAGAPIDVLIPPLFRRTNAAVRGDGSVARIAYSDPESSGGRWTSSVEVVPGERPHSHETSDGAFILNAAGSGITGFAAEEPGNVKQGLLEVLLGATDGAPGNFGSGRPLPAPTIEEDATARLRGTHCDATHITAPGLLAHMVSIILRSRTDPARVAVGCIASIDISYTSLGTLGLAGPATLLDATSAELPWLVDACFFPDQDRPLAACSDATKVRLAGRNAGLALVAPLLFVPAASNYRVAQLACSHCGLTDSDAEALAAILSHKSSKTHQCHLTAIDLSYNHITDAGAAVLLRALRKNQTLSTLILKGNDAVTKQATLDKIDRCLERNRRVATQKPSWLRRLLPWRA